MKSPLRSSPWYGSWVLPVANGRAKVPIAFRDVVFCWTPGVKKLKKIKTKNKTKQNKTKKTIVNSSHS